jgi:hypothetical protein
MDSTSKTIAAAYIFRAGPNLRGLRHHNESIICHTPPRQQDAIRHGLRIAGELVGVRRRTPDAGHRRRAFLELQQQLVGSGAAGWLPHACVLVLRVDTANTSPENLAASARVRGGLRTEPHRRYLMKHAGAGKRLGVHMLCQAPGRLTWADMLERLTIDSFSPLLGDQFTLHVDATRTLVVKLAEVTDLSEAARSTPAEGQRTPFSIVFRGASNAVLPQGIYRLEHVTLGGFEPFLVTIGPDAIGMRYEAVFT